MYIVHIPPPARDQKKPKMRPANNCAVVLVQPIYRLGKQTEHCLFDLYEICYVYGHQAIIIWHSLLLHVAFDTLENGPCVDIQQSCGIHQHSCWRAWF